ncbi:MAG: histidine ammonia-lyase [Bacteroidetes bacterium]|nr:histidine ammonia-lyase [Bacteroidota bacterium]HET6244856.1 histidine ammonia-lyase [Bacteroidia bacterium]
MQTHYITSGKLEFSVLDKIIRGDFQLELSPESISKINHCREYLDKKIASEKKPIYGINTGFGSLYSHSISEHDLETLQQNLVKSHACGTGEEVPEEIVKLMLLLKIQALSYGNSGVQLETVNRLVYFYNNNILPIVYQLGSLGASGDLAPLAHLCLPLIGEGEVSYKGNRIQTQELYKDLQLSPIHLKSKEGLALLNGTQFMSAYSVHIILKTFRLSQLADIIAAVSLDAYDGRIEPFNVLVHQIRPHKGQQETAKKISSYLEGSELIKRPKTHVQDPYSFRCIPQVHGASKDLFDYVAGVFLTEINSVTDNPTIFPENDLIISAGNFHGQPLALSLDFLAIALAELGSISERRTFKLISGQRGLPPFLIANPGLNSGFMIPQYTAASIVSQNKQLCTPASVDTIDSSNGQEDHVSMGANSATKAYRVVYNVERILAIELFNAAQALDLRKPIKSSQFIEKFVGEFRQTIDFLNEDKLMYKEIKNSINFIQTVKLPGKDE